MMAATELKEYNAGEGLKRGLSPPTSSYDNDDSFAIGDDEEEVVEQVKDHQPVAESSPHPPSKDSENSPTNVNNTNKDIKTTPNKDPSHHTSTSPTPVTISSPSNTSTASPPTVSTKTSTSPTATSSTTDTTTATTSPTPATLSSTTPPSSLPSIPNGSPKLRPKHPASKGTSTSPLRSSGGTTSSPENERMVLSYNERLKMYEDVLQSDILEIHLLRELASQGVPESKGLRSLYWKVLLHYLPANKALWSSSLARDRKLYQDWVKELVIDPHSHTEKHSDHVCATRLRWPSPHTNLPLSLEQDSKWNAFFKDNELLAEIDKDVKRTFPHLHFFNQTSPTTGQTIESMHYHALKRILFIYAKLNPGIRYVQGMNELLGPIYYTFATDSDTSYKEHAEADAFFCFTNLMSEWRDNFCKTLDKSEMGIVGNMKQLNMLFKDRDPELWGDLEDKKMNPQFYSFRWITLLLSQEFELPDVLRLWDSLFADPERFNFFYSFCCAMLICVRERLLNGTFADNLKLLQSYPPIDFQVILATALEVHENTYVPPSLSKKSDTSSPHSTPYTSASISVPPPATTTTSSKLSLPSLFTKITPTSSPKEPPKDKPQEKPTIFNLPLGLGKFL